MSPRGHEDWGVSATALNASPDLPTAELAARLGALSLYDQTGQLLFADGFERGLAPWATVTEGTGAAVTLRNVDIFLGAYCCRLTGGSDGLRAARIVKDMPRPFLTRWGIESRARFEFAGATWRINLSRNDGSQRHEWEVQIDTVTRNITVLQADGTFATVVAAVSFAVGGRRYHPLKLVVDLATDKYVRLGFATQSIDLSAYSARLTASATLDIITLDLTCLSRAGLNDALDLDSVLITQNEP